MRESILSLFFLNKGKAFYIREIVSYLQKSPGAVQREIKNLESLNLISPNISGNRIYYRLNETHSIYEELSSIFRKKGFLIKELTEQLNLDTIQIAFIYGSYASDQTVLESDIDCFVIGTLDSFSLTSQLKKIESTYNREVNLFIITPEEFKAKNDSHFIKSVLIGAKLFIKGTDDQLQKLT